jgi:hypothetical protein
MIFAPHRPSGQTPRCQGKSRAREASRPRQSRSGTATTPPNRFAGYLLSGSSLSRASSSGEHRAAARTSKGFRARGRFFLPLGVPRNPLRFDKYWASGRFCDQTAPNCVADGPVRALGRSAPAEPRSSIKRTMNGAEICCSIGRHFVPLLGLR